jgi:hypothetical protein
MTSALDRQSTQSDAIMHNEQRGESPNFIKEVFPPQINRMSKSDSVTAQPRPTVALADHAVMRQSHQTESNR